MSSDSLPALSAPGIGSGLDVNSIVRQLMAAERQPLNALAVREQTFNQRLSAFGQMRSALASFQTALQGLSSGSKFQALSATSSDTKVLSATASGKATAASYQIEVQQLAQQQKLASAGYATTDAVIGSGTLTIQFGTYDSVANSFTANAGKATKSIVIDPANNTLAGIRDAINAANAGVTATVVNDGSAAGNRLVVTSTDSGAANSLKIGVTDDDGTPLNASGLSALAYDPTAVAGSGKNLGQVAAARDALLKIDGIAVAQSSNTLKNAIDGVTLNLAQTNIVGQTLTLTVSRDTKSITDSVQAFVDGYNGAAGTLKKLTAFNGVGAQNGVLQGDSTARGIQVQMRNLLGTSIGSGGALTTLSQIGVSFGSDGTLSLDSAKLNTAIDTNFDGIAALFAKAAKTTDSLVSFSDSSSKTQPGTYAVSVSQLATRGATVGSQAASLIVAAGSDQLNLTVDGTAVSVTLAAATYASFDALIAEIQSKINGATGTSGSVLVSHNAGVLSITSARFGSASQSSVTGGSAVATLLGAPSTTGGVNVAGTINGATASGNGQILSGATGNASEGLALRINSGATGSRGNVTYSTGYAFQVSQYLDSVLQDSGSLKTRTNGIDSSIKNIDKQQERLEARLVQIERRFRAQFSALDSMLSSMNATSNFLTQQLASLPGSSRNR